MVKNSEEMILQKRMEIVKTAKLLYETKKYSNITILEISKNCSLSRANIYNYFQSKEEIFLFALDLEFKEWIKDLQDIKKGIANEDHLADFLAASLKKRELMLKILSLHVHEIEESCSMEALKDFKKTFNASIFQLRKILKEYLSFSLEQQDSFIYGFFPYLNGIYPYIHPTLRQNEAVENLDYQIKTQNIYSMVYNQVISLLKGSHSYLLD